MSGPLEAFVLRKKVSRASNWRKHLNANTYIFPSLVSQGSGGRHAHLRPRRCCWVWEVGPGPARHTTAKAPGLFLLLFLRPAGGCRDHLCSPLRGLFSVLFLFCKPLGFLPCTLPEHTLHLASRGSCAGTCEESALWCLTVPAGAAPTRPAPARLGSMPALPCTPRPPLSLLAWSSSGPLNQLCPLSCGGHTSPGGRVRAWPQAQLFQQGEVCWGGDQLPLLGQDSSGGRRPHPDGQVPTGRRGPRL